jgi:hypothetical protein
VAGLHFFPRNGKQKPIRRANAYSSMARNREGDRALGGQAGELKLRADFIPRSHPARNLRPAFRF